MIEDKKPQAAYLRLKDAAILLALIAFTITVTASLINSLIEHLPDIWRFFILILWQSIVIIGIVALAFFSRRLSLVDIGLAFSGLRSGLFLGIKWGLGIFFAVVISGLLIQLLLPIPPEPQIFVEILLATRQPVELGIGILIGVILAPLAEELLFRGMLFPAMRDKLGLSVALILNGAVFAGMHMDLYRFLPLMVGGMLLAWSFNRTRNLYVAIAAHSTWNALMLMLLLLGMFAQEAGS
jgi:membrane protease YdiL (CAAX protease family)